MLHQLHLAGRQQVPNTPIAHLRRLPQANVQIRVQKPAVDHLSARPILRRAQLLQQRLALRMRLAQRQQQRQQRGRIVRHECRMQILIAQQVAKVAQRPMQTESELQPIGDSRRDQQPKNALTMPGHHFAQRRSETFAHFERTQRRRFGHRRFDTHHKHQQMQERLQHRNLLHVVVHPNSPQQIHNRRLSFGDGRITATVAVRIHSGFRPAQTRLHRIGQMPEQTFEKPAPIRCRHRIATVQIIHHHRHDRNQSQLHFGRTVAAHSQPRVAGTHQIRTEMLRHGNQTVDRIQTRLQTGSRTEHRRQPIARANHCLYGGRVGLFVGSIAMHHTAGHHQLFAVT